MNTFLDGPAAGVILQVRRTPILLRVVLGLSGKWDALDQPDDSPTPDEQVFVYILTEAPLNYHLCIRGKNRAAAGWYQAGKYKLLVPQPPESSVRSNQKWSEWCDAHRESLTPDWAKGKVIP